MVDALQLYACAILLYESILYAWFIGRFLTQRFPRWAIIFLALALQLLVHETNISVLKLGLNILCDLAVLLICYEGSSLHDVIYTIIFYATMFLCDTICAVLLHFINGTGLCAPEGITHLEIIMSVVSRGVLPLFICLLAKFWPKASSAWFYLYPVPIAIVTVQFLFSPFGKESLFYTSPTSLYILVVVFMYATMLYVILVQREQQKKREYLHKLQIMDVHSAEQLRYIREIQCAYKSLSKHIHDARHHLDLLNTFMLANRWEQAQVYLKDLYHELGSVVSSYTGNADIDSIIFSKQLAFPDVKISVEGSLPKSIPWLETVDICALLANALANAGQGCDGIIGAVIDVEFLYRDWLIITVKNPYMTPPVMSNGCYVSSKGPGHGLGIQNMQAVAKKYNGYLLIESADEIFKLDIMLQKGGNISGAQKQY